MSRGSRSDGRTTIRARLAIALVCCLVAAVLAPVPALAGDGATVFEVKPDEIDAEAGETVTIDIVVNEHGDLHGYGIDELSFDLEYDPDVLTVTQVEHGPMLAAGDDDATVDGAAEIDDDAGVVSVSQEREPSGDGARASESAATITVEIAADAEPTSEAIEITNSAASLVSSDYPQTAVEFDGVIHIDGGDEPTNDEADDAAPDGVTIADGAEIDSSDDATVDDSSDDAEATGGTASADDDSIPGFAVPAAVVGVLGTIAVIVAGRRR